MVVQVWGQRGVVVASPHADVGKTPFKYHGDDDVPWHVVAARDRVDV